MKPDILSTSLVLECDLFDVTRSLIQENGVIYNRDVIIHPGSAVIVPYFSDGTVALVRQYRHAAGADLLELPAGSLEDGESAEECAAREISEEIGFKAGKMSFLTEFYVSPGFLSEKMTVFLASDLRPAASDPDADEFISVVTMPLSEAAEMARSGGFSDAKTMLGLILAEKALGSDSGGPDPA